MGERQRQLSLLKEYEEACKVILNEMETIQRRISEEVTLPPFELLFKVLLLAFC